MGIGRQSEQFQTNRQDDDLGRPYSVELRILFLTRTGQSLSVPPIVVGFVRMGVLNLGELYARPHQGAHHK
jgi:hypothetical protein